LKRKKGSKGARGRAARGVAWGRGEGTGGLTRRAREEQVIGLNCLVRPDLRALGNYAVSSYAAPPRPPSQRPPSLSPSFPLPPTPTSLPSSTDKVIMKIIKITKIIKIIKIMKKCSTRSFCIALLDNVQRVLAAEAPAAPVALRVMLFNDPVNTRAPPLPPSFRRFMRLATPSVYPS